MKTDRQKEIKNDPQFAWQVKQVNEKWYFFDSLGRPSYPYDTKELAQKALEDYEYDMAFESYMSD